MASSAIATLALVVTGDVTIGPESFVAATNTASPAQTQIVALSSGANTITVPTGATRVSITNKPSGNTVAITLKGVAGDTGVALGLTDWDSFSLGSGVTSLVLNAASAVSVRVTFT